MSEERLRNVEDALKEILQILRSDETLGTKGLGSRTSELEERMKGIEEWRDKLMAKASVWVLVISGGVAALATLLKSVFDHYLSK